MNGATIGNGATIIPTVIKARGAVLLSGFGRARHRFVEAANDTRLAERDHGVKQRRSDGLPHDGYAAGIDDQPRLHSRGFCYGSRRVVARVMIPFGKGSKRIRGLCEQLGNFGIFPELVFGGLFVGKIFREKGS